MATRQVHQTIPCHVLQCVTKLIVGGATYQEVEVWSMTFLSPKRKVRILSFEKEKNTKTIPYSYRTKSFIGINVREISDCQNREKFKPAKTYFQQVLIA